MDLNNIEEKMNKTISVLQENLSEVRAGRANPAILNKITVSYYGVPTPINQMAGISVPEPRTIVIQPWDMSILKDIEKAINLAEIGINPMNDGKVIRLNFPELTEERRKELVKQVKEYAEEGRIAVRNIRKEILDYKFNDKSYYYRAFSNILLILPNSLDNFFFLFSSSFPPAFTRPSAFNTSNI